MFSIEKRKVEKYVKNLINLYDIDFIKNKND